MKADFCTGSLVPLEDLWFRQPFIEHPSVAIRLNNLAQLLQATNRLSEAEPLMAQLLVIFHASLGN